MAIAGDQSPDGTMPDVSWLEKFPHHPIFSFSDTEKTASMTTRNADVLVASGEELRMANFLEVKHSSERNRGARHTYRRLRSPKLDFAIEDLVVNPTGKLLAVVGSHQVVIVVLPRSGALAYKAQSSSATDQVHDIHVKAAAVGPYYHHPLLGSRAKISKTLWHPWGYAGNSLLVMTRDGILREYDAEDIEEPVQTLSIFSSQDDKDAVVVEHDRLRQLRSRSRSQTPNRSIAGERARRSTSRFAFEENSDSGDETLENDFDKTFHTASGSIANVGTKDYKVVSFALGLDLRSAEADSTSSVAFDWSPMTIYALCSTGDVYALCPFLPKSATIPSSYLHSLASLVTLQQSLEADADLDEDITEELSNADAARFVAALLKEASSQRSARMRASTPQKPRRAMSATPMSIDFDEEEDIQSESPDDLVNVHSPTQIRVGQPAAQGPFLLTPAPHELSDDREANATDIFFTRFVKERTAGLNVVGIASDDGRVDLCVVLDPVRPRWHSTRSVSRSRRSTTPRKAGRYALSDSEDEEDKSYASNSLEDPHHTNLVASLPQLLVYESIDLNLASIAGETFEAKEEYFSQSAVHFVQDPLYQDTVYVHHIAGVHAIGFGRWASDLSVILQQADGGEGQLQRMLHQGTSSDVAFVVSTTSRDGQRARPNPIASICVVTDIYLCYALLALAKSGSLVAFELSLRVEDDSVYEDAREGDTSRLHLGGENVAYTTVLEQAGDAFEVPEPFASLHGMPSMPKIASDPSRKEELRVTPDTLRNLASTVQALRIRVRDIVKGGNTVQARLELQMEEFKRQLVKIGQIHSRLDNHQKAADTDDQNSMANRLKRIMERQGTIAKRSDRLLQSLIDSHSPELSKHETQWLAEMQRLDALLGSKADNTNPSQSSEDTMTLRLQALRHQLDELKAQMDRHGDDVRAQTRESLPPTFSTKQLQAIEETLAKQSRLLESNRSKVHKINSIIRKQPRASSLS